MEESELLIESGGVELDLASSQSCQDPTVGTVHPDQPFLRLHVTLYLLSVLCSDVTSEQLGLAPRDTPHRHGFPLSPEILLFACLPFLHDEMMKAGILPHAHHCLPIA